MTAPTPATPAVDRPHPAMPAADRPHPAMPEPRQWPIRDYAAIGDCHGAALVSRDGSIDWCCLRRFDGEPCFARLLDAEAGGAFELRPAIASRSRRAYLPDTNVLVTRFDTEAGSAEVIDLMPVGRQPGSGVRRGDAVDVQEERRDAALHRLQTVDGHTLRQALEEARAELPLVGRQH